MNDNLTLNALAYNRVYSDQARSLRRNTTAGVTLPRELTMSHIKTKDNVSKENINRSSVKHDVVTADADGNPVATRVSVQLIITYPTDVGVSASVSTAIDDGIVAIRQLISGTGADASALNLAANLKNGEQ
jgi:hypothetical protein